MSQDQSIKALGAIDTSKITCQEGWQCPICKAVMAPWKPSCINCTGAPQLTISGTPDIMLVNKMQNTISNAHSIVLTDKATVVGDAQCSN